MSLDPRHHVIDTLEHRVRLRRRPIDDDHLDPQRARRVDLRAGRRPAAVLGDQSVDPLVPHQGDLGLDGERSARQDQPLERASQQADRSSARGTDAKAPAQMSANCTPPTVRKTRRAWAPSAATAAAMSATRVQRSPGCSTPGRPGKPRDRHPQPAAGSAACRDICAANGWVASTTASTRCSIR